jgi:hypothetical protein
LTVLLAATATSAEPTAPAGPGASPVQASRSRDALAVSGGVAAVLFSATDGAIVAVREKGRQGSIASSGEHGLWHVRFQDGSTLDAARFAADSAERTFSHEADPAAQKLRMNYRSAVINVSVVVSGREDGVELVGQVHAAETVSRLLVGQPAPESLRAYTRLNGIQRRLEDKTPPELLAKFKQAVLVFYAGNCAEKLAHLDKLPVPTLVHFSDYLKGGFDKEYPDHLPPRAAFGTPAEFRRFFDRCHDLGHLVMPYTNPTWWCDHPRGPTFQRAGDAPLLRTRDGKLSCERYAANDGYTVCHWHPAVQQANRETVRQFCEDYPVDVLFQDQCGARSWHYDLNPASPTPYAYADGLVSMVAEDSARKPLSTESGWDRVVNYESQLCGLSWQLVPTEGGPEWRRFLKHEYPPQTWDIFPVAQYIAHDKTALLHHDLGQFVTNPEIVAWTLGLGFGMSYSCAAASLAHDGPREWLRWLDRLQKSVCARYVGQPLQAFEHDRGRQPTVEDDGILRAVYAIERPGQTGPTPMPAPGEPHVPLQVVANLGPESRVERGRHLTAHGFHVTAPGLIAGRLRKVGATDYGADGVSFVVEGDTRRADVWVYSPAEREVAVELPSGMVGDVTVALDGAQPTAVRAAEGVVRFRLPERPGRSRVTVPAPLAGKAPRDWPGAKPPNTHPPEPIVSSSVSYLWHGLVQAPGAAR